MDVERIAEGIEKIVRFGMSQDPEERRRLLREIVEGGWNIDCDLWSELLRRPHDRSCSCPDTPCDTPPPPEDRP